MNIATDRNTDTEDKSRHRMAEEVVMKAVVQDAYGSSEVLHLRDTRRPRPATTRCSFGSWRPASIGPPGTS